MSYDIDLGPKSFNITSNISGMFYAYDEENGISGLYGKTAKESLTWLSGLYTFLVCNEEAMRKLEPSNGWGSYTGTIEWVHKLIMAALQDEYNSVWEGD